MYGPASVLLMTANWSERLGLSKENVERSVRPEAGVYRLVEQHDDGQYYVFYAGQAVDLRSRLLQHMGASEANTCIREKVRASVCAFRVAYLSTQAERDAEEHVVIHEYEPACNKQQP